MAFFQIFLGLGQFLLVTLCAFVVLVVIASHLRFQALTQDASASEGQSVDLRAGFELSIAHLLGTVHREPEPFCVMLAVPRDGDKLAQEYGDMTANEVLSGIEERFKKNLRSSDIVSIYHDNRVGVIIDAERCNARQVVQRLLKEASAEQYKCKSGLVLPLNVVVGLVSHPENSDKTQALLEGAEQALSDAMQSEEGWHMLPDEAAADGKPDTKPGSRRSGEARLIDPLTGLLKPSKVGPAVQKYVAHYRRLEEPVSMLLIEIDHLDRYSEHYGDEARAEILGGLGRFLQDALRETDLLAMLGEEEFLVVLGCSPSNAQLAGHRLVSLVKRTPFFVSGSNLRVSISIGVAGYPDHGGLPRYLLESADRALNVAKENGRGMCVKFEPSMGAAKRVSHPTDVF